MTDVAVIILQKDEMLHIGRCLEKLKPLEAKQTFVVDCFSTDGSDKLAGELGATVVKHEWPGNQAEQFQWALENLPIETGWILRIDADEYLTAELIDEIKAKLSGVADDVAGVVLKRRHVVGWLGDRWVKRGMYPTKIVRLFRTGHGKSDMKIMDEHIVLDGPEIEFEHDFVDHSLIPFEDWKAKHKAYATREAMSSIAGQKSTGDHAARKMAYYKMPRYIRAIGYFLYRYFLKLGVLEGVAGLRWHYWHGLWYRWNVDSEIGRLKRGTEKAPPQGAHGEGEGKRPIRILHVLPSLRLVDGGPATSVPQTAMAQMEAGMEVGIAYFDARDLTDAAQEAFAKGVKAHPFRGSHRRLNRIKFSFDMLFRFKRVARDYDVIVTHLNWIFATWWAAHVARKLGKPYIMMPRGCISPNAMANGSWKKWLVGPLDRFALRRAAAVWTTSPMEAKWAKKYVPEAKVDIMPMGLDTSLYSASRVKAPGEKILLFMSRISAIKALDMLAEAWKEVWTPGWKLVMVGPDDRGHLAKMKRLYEQECSEGSYAFRAALYGEAKAKMLREASAFILPSRSENWSVSISEAMASALPVICTMGAPWGIIPEIGAGWRTEISAQGLKRALGEMMEKSDQELYEMGVRGMRWVKENLDWRKVGEEMRERVERLVDCNK